MIAPDGYRFFEGQGFPRVYKDSVLKTDFRVWLRQSHLAVREDLSDEEKLDLSLRLCYRIINPEADAAMLLEGLSWFAQCGESDRIASLDPTPRLLEDWRDLAGSGSDRLYDPFWDFKSVWASFKREYDLDLYTVPELHWWGFVALLGGLSPDSPLGALISLRRLDPAAKPAKEAVIRSKMAALPPRDKYL